MRRGGRFRGIRTRLLRRRMLWIVWAMLGRFWVGGLGLRRLLRGFG